LSLNKNSCLRAAFFMPPGQRTRARRTAIRPHPMPQADGQSDIPEFHPRRTVPPVLFVLRFPHPHTRLSCPGYAPGQ